MTTLFIGIISAWRCGTMHDASFSRLRSNLLPYWLAQNNSPSRLSPSLRWVWRESSADNAFISPKIKLYVYLRGPLKYVACTRASAFSCITDGLGQELLLKAGDEIAARSTLHAAESEQKHNYHNEYGPIIKPGLRVIYGRRKTLLRPLTINYNILFYECII